MRLIITLLLLIPSLSWGLTFKDGKQVDGSTNSPKVSEEKFNKKYLDPNYIFKPHEKLKWIEDTGNWSLLETHGSISQNPWNLKVETDIVRDGEYSLRFEMRDSDCYGDDCPRGDRKGAMGRSEITTLDSLSKKYSHDHGEHWYAWSMYIPEGTNHIRPAYTILGQFKMPSDYIKQLDRVNSSGFDEDCPEIPIVFKLEREGVTIEKDGVLQCEGYGRELIIPTNALHNKWHDFLMNVNWTDKEDGFIDLWINDKLVYQSKGKTFGKLLKRKKDGKKMGPNFRFGIYNGKRKIPVKTQVAYYDSFRSGKKCKKTALFHDCNNLPK